MPKPSKQDYKKLNITEEDNSNSKENAFVFPTVEDVDSIKTNEQYDVFICYRRATSAFQAETVYNKLIALGYNVYKDTSDDQDGNYLNRSIHFVKNCKDFIIICTDGCMEWRTEGTDVFYNEIWHAVNENKNIIPALMSDKFSFPFETPDCGEEFKENWERFKYRNVKIFDIHYPKPFYDNITNLLTSTPIIRKSIPQKNYFYSPCFDSTMLERMGIVFDEDDEEREFLNSLSDAFINKIAEDYSEDISKEDLDTIRDGDCKNVIAWLLNKHPDLEKDIAEINRDIRKENCLDKLDTSNEGFVHSKKLKRKRIQIKQINLTRSNTKKLDELGFLTIGEFESLETLNLSEFSNIPKGINDKVADAIKEYEEAKKKTADDQAAAKEVIDEISKLTDITLKSEEAISSAKNHYNKLTPDQQKLVSNYGTLVKADETLSGLKDEQKAKLEAEEKARKDHIAANKVEGEIGKFINATHYGEKAIANARDDYDNLTQDQKKLVSNYNLLVYQEALLLHDSKNIDAFEKFKESADLGNVNAMICVGRYFAFGFNGLKADINKASNWYNKALEADPDNDIAKKYLDDSRKAIEVISEIKSLPPVSLENEQAFKQAEKKYNKLTDEQKKYVSNYDDLVKAEKRLSELKDKLAAKRKAEEEARKREAADLAVVKNIISEIGKLTDESLINEKSVSVIKDHVKGLTPTQKALLPSINEALKTLDDILESKKQYEEEEKKKAFIKSNFDISGGVLKKYIGNGGDVIIPNTVTEIGMWAFKDCSKVKSVVIPHSVSTIGTLAFENCTGITKLTIPDSVKSIGFRAFEGCTNLQWATVGNSVQGINERVFSECQNLDHVSIGSSVEFINDRAFLNCHSLREIKIPQSVTFISKNAFAGCDNIKIIHDSSSSKDKQYANDKNKEQTEKEMSDEEFEDILKDLGL